uniref:YTH domain-containing family protein n=2 Tax=Opuntia streptacantha TaxID=393608 RepID=A0A7C9DNL6_OPUST
MVCEKLSEQSNGMENGMAVSNTAEQATVPPENGVPSDCTIAAEHTPSNIRGKDGQELAVEKDVFNQPTSYYNYYYPGYNGSFGQSDGVRDNSTTGVQPDHSSIAYYMPGYNPYAAGAFVGANGQCVRPAYFTSSGYLQAPVTYGTEALPCYAWDVNYLGNASNGSTATSGALNSSPSPATLPRSNGIKPSKLYGPAIVKNSTVSSDPKSRHSVAASNASRPKFDTQPLKPSSKSGSTFQSAGFANAYHPIGNFQSLPFQKRGPYANNGTMGYRTNARIWNGNDKLRLTRKTDCEMPTELTCGPRGNNRSSSTSSEPDQVGMAVQKDKYNLAEFQTDYDNARFYVIKSYSEDDVHKCLKYDVWSSTANGNKKLDAAFHDAEVKATETGIKCPIFLFFSVNGSGQFVGVAEMIGKVDFNKSMDFWQLDKWSGFFPVKWHIVKDIPNSQLRHILLENNENRPVTYTRDTQEVGLKQGLDMLKIFKNYLAKTSLVDDFEFYEAREKALQNKRSSKSGVHQTHTYGNGIVPKQLEMELKGEEGGESQVLAVSGLADLTKKLSIDSGPEVAL